MLTAMSPISGAGPSVAAGTSGVTGLSVPATKDGDHAAPFADLLTDAVGDVSRLEDQARKAVSGLMTGSGVDVHEAMIATQKASMAFELSLAVRNKAIQAYQQIISMQF